MSNFVISSDSTCDLSPQQIKENNISINPLTIILGEKEYLDNVDIDSERVIKFVDETGNLPKTAATSIQAYIDFFTKLTEGGKSLIHFCISSKSSACYNNALVASKEVKNVFVVDSVQLSTGQGLLVLQACDLRKEGKSAKEAFDYIEDMKHKVQTSFIVDRLDYLHKGGRCSLMALIGAKIMKIHPFISMVDGALKVKKKYSGNMIVSVNKYIADLAAEYQNYKKCRCFITHCIAERDIVDAAIEKTKQLFNFDEIIETTAGATISSHCGKNTIGLLFITE